MAFEVVFFVNFFLAKMTGVKAFGVVVLGMETEFNMVGEFLAAQQAFDSILHIKDLLYFVFVLF